MVLTSFDRYVTAVLAVVLLVAAVVITAVEATHGADASSLPTWLQSLITLVFGYYFGAHARDLQVSPGVAPKGS